MNKEEADLIIAEQNKSTEEILKAVAKVKADYHELCKLKDMRIAELEAQVEKMKVCQNCHHHFFNSYDVMECAEGLNVTSKHCDKWECRL